MDDTEIRAFWVDARVRAGLNPVESYIGATGADTVPPPAWSFGSSPEQADRLLELVLAGRKTATASVLWEYEAEARARLATSDEHGRDDDGQDEDGQDGEGHGGGARGRGEGDTLIDTGVDLDLDLPAPGSLSILLDGHDSPRALIRTTHVEVVRFGDVDEDHARREGEGTLEQWRAQHLRFFEEHAPVGQRVDEETRVVLERFVAVVPATARRAARRAGLL